MTKLLKTAAIIGISIYAWVPMFCYAVTFGNSTQSSGAGSSLTYSHTVAASSNILLVGVSYRSAAAASAPSVTYNGVAMTVSAGRNSTNLNGWIFYLKNPASGAHNVVITHAGGVSRDTASTASSYQADNFPDTFQSTSTNPATTAYLQFTPSYADCWLAGFFGNRNSSTLTAGTSTTRRVVSLYGGGGGMAWYDNNAVTSTRLTETSGSGETIGLGYSLCPTQPSTGTSNRWFNGLARQIMTSSTCFLIDASTTRCIADQVSIDPANNYVTSTIKDVQSTWIFAWMLMLITLLGFGLGMWTTRRK